MSDNELFGISEQLEASHKKDHVADTGKMVGDLISRQAAISEIMEDLKDRSLHDDPATPEDYAEGYDEGIRNAAAIVLQMPSAQQWIPCSERLPEDDKDVLVTDGEDFAVAYWRKDAQAWDDCLHGWCDLYGLDVVAWMPLPEPWKGGDQA